MKIFFVSARGDSFGGASLHVRDMARRLMDDGHEVKIAVGGTPDMEVPKRFREKDLDFICIPSMGRSINPFKDFRAIANLRKEIKAFGPDLVSTHASKAGALGRVACMGLSVPVIYTPHCWSFVDGFPKAWVYRLAEKCLAPFTSKIITVSEDEKLFGLGEGVGKVEQTICIHNGVFDNNANQNNSSRSEDDKPVRILMVGRFEKQKDQPLLLEALADLKELNWELTLVGAGPELDRSTALADELGISSKVDFAGYSSKVEEHLKDSDIFTLITHWEGFPRSILEAMSAGLPVVASDVGGSRESVINGANGYIVPQGEKEDLASALRSLILNSKLRAKMGAESRRMFVENFTFDHMYRRYTELYESLAA